MDTTETKYLTVSEVAAELRVTPRTVHTWIDDGKLPAFKLGGTTRIIAAAFADFVASNSVAGGAS
ncbi:helix-turn-helix domain-containing protein [Nocardioides sp.]|uniref:helix-turn-helix domain-containing protein n=1 Tax=Nocardioides sp. TaxID=35761 RepID=UPI00321B5FAC